MFLLGIIFIPLEFLLQNFYKSEFIISRIFIYFIVFFIGVVLIFSFNKYLLKLDNINNIFFIFVSEIIIFNSSSYEKLLQSNFQKIISIEFYFFLFLIIFLILFFLKNKKLNIKIAHFIILFSILNLIYNFSLNTFFKNKKIFAFDKQQLLNLSHQNKIYEQISEKSQFNNPNIFFIVMDSFQDLKNLKKIYDYYPNNFVEFLNSKKFEIKEKTYSTSIITAASMSNMLNMVNNFYYNKDKIDLDTFSFLESQWFNSKNSVQRILKQRGYKYFYYKSGIFGPKCPELADKCFESKNFLKEQDIFLINKTPFLRVYARLFDKTAYLKLRHPERYELDELTNDIEKKDFSEKTFFYIHSMLPHAPYRYNSNCSLHSRIVNLSDKRATEKEYLNQFQCATKQIENLINKIIKIDTDAMIVIVSDTGSYVGFENLNPDITRINFKQQEQISSVFLAIKKTSYCKYNFETPNVTSNLFRYIFSCLDNEKYPEDIKKVSIVGYPDWPNFDKVKILDINQFD
tara:strand:+ start:1224 stop:2768 length:1545 start_codon:yes stop_codon:yes gene_type:complete